MTFEIWLTFIAASTVLLLIPGPTILLVMTYAISQGRRVALATVAGVALGDFIAMTVSLAGLGVVVLASAKLFLVLKWIGAAYLVYLGVKLIRSASETTVGDIANPSTTTSRAVFGHATMVTALNPKSIVFFIAFVPQFVTAEHPLLPQFSILVVTFITLAALNALAYALLADRLRDRISHPKVLANLSKLGGGVLIAMGVATAAFKRTT